jgi:thermitase
VNHKLSIVMKPVIFSLCFLIFASIFSDKISAGDFFLRLSGEKITLHADNTPLADILKDLQGKGVSIGVDPLINPTVTAAFYQQSVDRVLASILKSYNYSLVWERTGSTTESPLSLVEIQIFQQGKENRIEPLQKDNNLQVVQGADGVLFVKNRLLIRLNPPVNKERLKNIIHSVGASILDSFQELGIVRLQLPESADPRELAETLSGYDEISVAEPDYAYPLEDGRIIAATAHSTELLYKTDSSESALVAVLDSGLSQQYAGSPFVSGVYDAFSNSTDTSDTVGHGTQMSLIASGSVSPLGVDANQRQGNAIVAVRAFDDNGFTSNYTLMRSVDYAIGAKAQVISMSWGSEQSNPMLETVVQYATDKGLILVAAAGNSPTGKPVYPAAYKNVIGVGALAPNGTLWEQSNYGDFVSVYAPGVAQMPVGHNGSPGIYAGTSISTAYIASKVVQILEDQPDADIGEILSILNSNN